MIDGEEAGHYTVRSRLFCVCCIANNNVLDLLTKIKKLNKIKSNDNLCE